MRHASYARTLDDLLTPLGFNRAGDDWVRVRGDMWECVNRQASWRGGLTVNLEAKDLKTEEVFLEVFGPYGAVLMPPVSVRIGTLVDGRDRWWMTDDPEGPASLTEALREHGLPWFDRVRTLEEQALYWYGRQTALSGRGYHGASMVRLALTLFRMGETAEACRILSKPAPRTALPRNVRDVSLLREWLGCAEDAVEPAPEPGPIVK